MVEVVDAHGPAALVPVHEDPAYRVVLRDAHLLRGLWPPAASDAAERWPRRAPANGVSADRRRAEAGRTRPAASSSSLLAGQPLTDVGPAPGSGHLERDVLLARVGGYLDIAWGMGLAGQLDDPSRALLVMALNVAPRHPRRETFADIAAALELPPFGPLGMGAVALAATIAATPGVTPAS